MPTVCILSAAYRRLAVTRLVLEQRQRLCGELAGRGITARMLIVADDENLDLATEYGAETLEHPNLPLGRKCNAGLRRAAEDSDYVVWIGSDDWIHADVFKRLTRYKNCAIVTGRRLVVVDMRRGVLQQIKSPSKYGAIPWLINSQLLRTHRDPIPEHLSQGLDGALVRGIRLTRIKHELRFHDPHPFRCVDFKTSENITPYRGLAKHLADGREEPNPWASLARWYPADLVERARALSDESR